jgi:hypothetical protein
MREGLDFLQQRSQSGNFNGLVRLMSGYSTPQEQVLTKTV